MSPRHERMTCAKCKRMFWGETSFDTHRPCGETEMRGKYVVMDGYLYVLKRDRAAYETIGDRMRKAREGKRK